MAMSDEIMDVVIRLLDLQKYELHMHAPMVSYTILGALCGLAAFRFMRKIQPRMKSLQYVSAFTAGVGITSLCLAHHVGYLNTQVPGVEYSFGGLHVVYSLVSGLLALLLHGIVPRKAL
jgi:hypothetical protein